ncbi:MAG: tetratricopeptide repeat protein [Rubricoccaceae bacterium]|nr:tetratricopeptide repeat protein [Rubricoccaceae bacterium]
MVASATARRSPFLLAALGLVASLLAGCASTGRVLTPEDYRAALPALEARAEAAPEDADALRDLGEAYAQTEQFARAKEVLVRAEALEPGHPQALYYLGLSEEGLNAGRAALAYYDRYEEVPERSPYRLLIEGRRSWLVRVLVREELEELLAAEDALTAEGVTEAVAVFPLAYQGEDPTYAPLSRGLAEMVTVDLVALGRVRVVERVRLQALLDELSLSSGAAFDAATAPRAGMLLRSGRIVGGELDVEAERLQTDVALWEWPREEFPDLITQRAPLADLFALEKAIVYDLLAKLGVTLTEEEEEELARVPTESLQAFLAYSRGLLEEDAGRYAEAAAFYTQAVQIDPDFAEAAQKAREMTAMAELDGDVSVALTAARTTAPFSLPWGFQPGGGFQLGGGPPGGDLVGSRLDHLNRNIGVHFVPSDEAREPTAEGPLGPGGPPASDPIPDPPPPPAGGN